MKIHWIDWILEVFTWYSRMSNHSWFDFIEECDGVWWLWLRRTSAVWFYDGEVLVIFKDGGHNPMRNYTAAYPFNTPLQLWSCKPPYNEVVKITRCGALTGLSVTQWMYSLGTPLWHIALCPRSSRTPFNQAMVKWTRWWWKMATCQTNQLFSK